MKTSPATLYTLDRVEMNALMSGKMVSVTPEVLLLVDMAKIVKEHIAENGNGHRRKKSRACSECDAKLPNMSKLMKHRRRKHGKKSRVA